MNIKELAEQAGFVPEGFVWIANVFAIERFAELIREDERKVLDGILDQALKDQKDAERYMHLKWVITDNPLEKIVANKTSDQIDQMMDIRIRSYDE